MYCVQIGHILSVEISYLMCLFLSIFKDEFNTTTTFIRVASRLILGLVEVIISVFFHYLGSQHLKTDLNTHLVTKNRLKIYSLQNKHSISNWWIGIIHTILGLIIFFIHTEWYYFFSWYYA